MSSRELDLHSDSETKGSTADAEDSAHLLLCRDSMVALRRIPLALLCVLGSCSQESPLEPEGAPPEPYCTVGTWNLEYLHDRQSRGFPEFFAGGPTYGPRTDGDYAVIANVIKTDLNASLLVLQEINAQSGAETLGSVVSIELERLRGHLGAQYAYVISQSGGNQHVALLWNTAHVQLDTVFEITYSEIRVEGKDLFSRDPLVAKFTVLSSGM